MKKLISRGRAGRHRRARGGHGAGVAAGAGAKGDEQPVLRHGPRRLLPAQEEDDVECVYIGPGEHTELEQIQIVQDLITQGRGRHRRGAVERPGHGPRAAGRGRCRHPGDDLGCRPAGRGQAHPRHLRRHPQLRHRREPRQDRDGPAPRRRHRLPADRRRGGGEPQRAPSGHPRHAGRTLGHHAAGDPLAGENGWTEISGCPLITDDDGNAPCRA
jgi:ribose transport system substrate-binding protein